MEKWRNENMFLLSPFMLRFIHEPVAIIISHSFKHLFGVLVQVVQVAVKQALTITVSSDTIVLFRKSHLCICVYDCMKNVIFYFKVQ